MFDNFCIFGPWTICLEWSQMGPGCFFFRISTAQAKNGPRWPQMGPGGFFPTNPDLADILGRTDFDFEDFYLFLYFSCPCKKWAQMGPKWGQEDFFPTNPDLPDILGRTDFDFENCYFLDFWVPKSFLGTPLAPKGP